MTCPKPFPIGLGHLIFQGILDCLPGWKIKFCDQKKIAIGIGLIISDIDEDIVLVMVSCSVNLKDMVLSLFQYPSFVALYSERTILVSQETSTMSTRIGKIFLSIISGSFFIVSTLVILVLAFISFPFLLRLIESGKAILSHDIFENFFFFEAYHIIVRCIFL